MTTELSITTRRLNVSPYECVHLDGELDIATANDLKETIVKHLQTSGRDFILNLEGVRHIDSSGLAAFLFGRKECGKKQGRFILICTSPRILKVLAITGMDRIFSVVKDEQEALELLSSPPG